MIPVVHLTSLFSTKSADPTEKSNSVPTHTTGDATPSESSSEEKGPAPDAAPVSIINQNKIS